LLVITECAVQRYRKFLSEAARLIGKRDPDDVELLALALALGIPIWSNDRDFEVAGVECYTTARLLKKLGL
jgi:predicted nucleic acid-binding protein